MQCCMPISTAYLYACFTRSARRSAKSRPLPGCRGMQCCMPISTAYLYAGFTRSALRSAISRPLPGRRGMQCCMPISTAYLYACVTETRIRCNSPSRTSSITPHIFQGGRSISCVNLGLRSYSRNPETRCARINGASGLLANTSTLASRRSACQWEAKGFGVGLPIRAATLFRQWIAVC